MGVHSVSLVVKQQHDGVEFPARPIVGTQRHDEVVEPVARRLSRDNNQLVLEPIGLGIFIAVVFAALGMWGGTQARHHPGCGRSWWANISRHVQRGSTWKPWVDLGPPATRAHPAGRH